MSTRRITSLLGAGLLLILLMMGPSDGYGQTPRRHSFPPIDPSRVDCTAFRKGNEAQCYKTANEVYQLNLLILSQFVANDFAQAELDVLPHAPQMFPDGTVIYGVGPENAPIIADLFGSTHFEFVTIKDTFAARVLDKDTVILYGPISFTIRDHTQGSQLRTLDNVQTEMFRRNPRMPRGWEFVYEQLGYLTPLLGE